MSTSSKFALGIAAVLALAPAWAQDSLIKVDLAADAPVADD